MKAGRPVSARAIVFDFDYTLADSSTGVIESVNFALARMDLPEASADLIRKTIGMALPATFATVAGPQPAGRDDEFYDLFIQRADEVMAESTFMLEASPLVVSALHDRGTPLGIVSSKYRRRMAAILARVGLLRCFRIIVGGEDVAAMKPDPSGLLKAVGTLRCDPEDALFVGDTVIDAQTAASAGVPFAAVLTGVTPEADFEPYSPVWVMETLAALPALVDGSTG